MCLSHARWNSIAVSLDVLLVALADKLLEGHAQAGSRATCDRWSCGALGKERSDVFVELDTLFEEVAAEGSKRLE